MVSLKLSNLAHEFDDRVVFRGLNVERDGPYVAVTGPNGSGKTTLLRILAGLLTPTSGVGEVLVDGKPVTRDELRHAVGLAGPDVCLYPELTARENLRFLASARGLEDRENRIAAALDRVGLTDRADEPVSELSAGLRQRASIAAAVVHEPTVLLLDEPSNSLDESGVQMLRALIDEQAKTGLIVLATNNPAEAADATGRIDLG